MSTKPITFTLAMARKLAHKKKRQTRRLIRHEHIEAVDAIVADATEPGVWRLGLRPDGGATADMGSVRAGFVAGDVGWVREPYMLAAGADPFPPSSAHPPLRVHYLADGPAPDWAGKYRHARFMPLEWSRVGLHIDIVRAERVQDISDEDIAAEGVDAESVESLLEATTRRRRGDVGVKPSIDGRLYFWNGRCDVPLAECKPRDLWLLAWVLINGRETYDANAWVFAYDFTPTATHPAECTGCAFCLRDDLNDVDALTAPKGLT